MVYHAAARYETGANVGAEANMATMLAADASWAAADMCVQTFGGFGFAGEYEVERNFRETRMYRVPPISTNLLMAYLSDTIPGLPFLYKTAEQRGREEGSSTEERGGRRQRQK